MAITRAELLQELLPGLDALFGTDYINRWIAFIDYSKPPGNQIIKIARWDKEANARGDYVYGVIDIAYARDELDAYQQATKKLENQK